MKKRLTAEMWDKMQFLFRNYYDRTMHSVFYYDSKIDDELLAKIYMGILDKTPVLRSTFHNHPIKPYWTINEDYNVADFFEVVSPENATEYIEKFVATSVDYKAKVQMKVRIVREENKDTLVVLINHMCFDGGDFKYFNTKVAEYYNKYLETGELVIDIKQGTRSAEQVYDDMTEEQKAHAKSLYKNISTTKNKVVFPFAPTTKDDRPRIIREKLSKELFTAMRVKGKENGATINDILLGSYFHSLYKICEVDESATITVPSMIDLRRYINGGQTKGLTNCTGFMPCTLTNGAGATIDDTIAKVQEALAPSKKDPYLGLYSLPLLKLAYTILPQCISEIAIKIGYTNPYIGMSNIGIIKAEDFKLGEANIYDAWYSGALKYKPYMQLALTTFNSEITFSIAIRGNDEDERIFRAFLNDIVNNIRDYVK